MKKAIIVGATSGIGNEVARLLLKQGWTVGVAGRRLEPLQTLAEEFPKQVFWARIDVVEEDASTHLLALIEQLGGMQLFLLSSGIGYQNPGLDVSIELATAQTNVLGFIRMVEGAYQYFSALGGGHLAIISSIAGTQGIGIAPAYSATKRFQSTYIQALDQLAQIQKKNIVFTDIRPGFVATNLLNDGANYPMVLPVAYVAKKIVQALAQQKRIVVLDWRYRILVFLWRLLPQWLWRKLSIQTKPLP